MTDRTEAQRKSKQACYDRIYGGDPNHWVLLTSGVFAMQTNTKSMKSGAMNPSETGCWEPQRPVGIRNFGNTCYLNTALQAIAPMFTEAAWPGETKNDGTGSGCTLQELVDHHFREEILTQYNCSQCCEGAARRTVTQRLEIIQEEGPAWLAIAVARVCLQGHAQRKIVREVKLSAIVNIPVTNQAGIVQITPYQVVALGNHQGEGSAAGHYVVYTSMPARGDGLIYKISDTQVGTCRVSRAYEQSSTGLRLIVLKRMVNAQAASLLVYNRKQPLSSNLIMSAQTSSLAVGPSNSGGAGGASGSPSQFIPFSRSSLVLPTSGRLESLNTPPRTGSKACEMGNSPVSASLTSQAEEEYEADFTLTTPVRAPKHVGISTNPLLHRHAQSGVESKRVRKTIVQEREWSDALHYYDSIPKTNPDTVRKQRGVLELLKFAKLSECNLKIMESPSQDIGSNNCFVFAIAMAVSLLHGLGPVRNDQYAGKRSWRLEPQSTVTECCFTKKTYPSVNDFFVFTCNSEMTEVIIENNLQCGEVKQVSVNDNLEPFTNLINLYQLAQRTNDSEQMKTLVKQAMEGLQVALSQLKVMAANLWVLWLIAWAPSAPVGVTVPEQDCITSFDLALKHWLDAKLDTEFALPKDNFIIKTKVRLMRLASRLRAHYGKNFIGRTYNNWQDVQAFITREIAKRDSSQVEGMVEVKEAVGTSETGLGRPGIQTIYYQVLDQASVKAASVDRFEASVLLEKLDRGSDGKLAEAAAVVKSQMASVCKKNDAKGFGLFATNNWTSQSSECAEIIDVNTLQDCLHYTECVSLERTLSTAGLQFYHPATILFVDGTGLTEAAVSATNSLKSVRLTRANSLSTSASSDVARPMTAPSSSSASSSSRVGRRRQPRRLRVLLPFQRRLRRRKPRRLRVLLPFRRWLCRRKVELISLMFLKFPKRWIHRVDDLGSGCEESRASSCFGAICSSIAVPCIEKPISEINKLRLNLRTYAQQQQEFFSFRKKIRKTHQPRVPDRCHPSCIELRQPICPLARYAQRQIYTAKNPKY
eukprot:g45238.t1